MNTDAQIRLRASSNVSLAYIDIRDKSCTQPAARNFPIGMIGPAGAVHCGSETKPWLIKLALRPLLGLCQNTRTVQEAGTFLLLDLIHAGIVMSASLSGEITI